MRSKKKLLTTATALTTAAAMLLGGTFAWQSISQSALNESTDTINPGGRLHNDIAAVENDPNATYNFIYVENFSGDEDEDGIVTGGEDIFARIRLEEYMELVMNYGVDGMEIVRNIAGAKTLKDGVDDVSADGATKQNKFDYTYELHFFDEDVENAADNYWTWQLGNKANAENYGGYMPTFNKNKDSLAVDQNGSYTAAIGGIIEREENYDMSEDSGFVAYEADEEKTANAIYDNDGNDSDELAALSAADLKDIIENGDSSDKWNTAYADAVHLENESHTARAIPETKGVISMEAWLELDAAEQGNYWVYDTDGWVYWSSAIKPGTATGPLLEGFALDHEMDDTWYYAINVVAQFVTADDLGKNDNTGFYDESGWYDPTGLGEEKAAEFEGAGQAPSENALKLLEKIGVQTKEEDDMPTLEMLDFASNQMSSTVAWISVEPGETIRVKNTDGNVASEDYLTVSVRGGGTDLEKDTDYTYENGLLTITAPEGATWLNENGTALQVMCNDLDTEASGIGYIVYDDDGALTLNTDSSSEHGPDITVVPLGSSVTVSGEDGAKSYVLQVGYEYAPLSAASGYNSTTGVWTITNEEWVGKVIKVVGDGTHVEGYGFVLVTAAADSGSGDDSDVPNTDHKLDLKAYTWGTVNYVSFVSVDFDETILLDGGNSDEEYTVELLTRGDSQVTFTEGTNYTLEDGVLTIKESETLSGGTVVQVSNADASKSAFVVVDDDGEISNHFESGQPYEAAVIRKGKSIQITNYNKEDLGWEFHTATSGTDYSYSQDTHTFTWLAEDEEDRLVTPSVKREGGIVCYIFVAADEDSDTGADEEETIKEANLHFWSTATVMSLDDTVLVKWNGAANDSLESVELYYMTNEGSKAVALSGGTDYTFENSELKLLDGGKVTAGNVVALSDGYEKDTALLVEPLDGELTLLAKSDVETDQPLPLRVVKATLNQPLTLKLDDGSAPASIDTQKSFINEAHISGDPITITDDDYSYDSSTGELTFTNADHAESWMAFKVTNTAGEDAYGFIYLTAAQN